MALITVERPRLYTVQGKHFLHVPRGIGEELRIHLGAHNIHSRLSRLASAPFDRLELEDDVDRETIQAILDHWEE